MSTHAQPTGTERAVSRAMPKRTRRVRRLLAVKLQRRDRLVSRWIASAQVDGEISAPA